eukprot:4771586-Prymnesium_polylepis.1
MACQNFTLYAHTDLAGIGIGIPFAGTSADCCATCEADAACLGAVAYAGFCYLKGGDVVSMLNTGRDAY